eukprot:7849049-Pyramimonas_sp.AAC.1
MTWHGHPITCLGRNRLTLGFPSLTRLSLCVRVRVYTILYSVKQAQAHQAATTLGPMVMNPALGAHAPQPPAGSAGVIPAPLSLIHI